MRERKYYSRAEKEELVREYQSKHQGEPKVDFCRKHGVAPTSFYKWLGIFGEQDVPTENFIKVELQPKTGYLKLFGFNLLRIELDV